MDEPLEHGVVRSMTDEQLTPPEYAAPARVWTRAEDWRGEPPIVWDFGKYRLGLFYTCLPSDPASAADWIPIGTGGKIYDLADDALVMPVLPGDLPEPPE